MNVFCVCMSVRECVKQFLLDHAFLSFLDMVCMIIFWTQTLRHFMKSLNISGNKEILRCALCRLCVGIRFNSV